jgi:hypothetical protein
MKVGCWGEHRALTSARALSEHHTRLMRGPCAHGNATRAVASRCCAADVSVRCNWEQAPQVSRPCWDLLTRLLSPVPGTRLTVSGALQHPWVTEGMPQEMRTLNDSLVQVGLAGSRSSRACAASLSLKPDPAARGFTMMQDQHTGNRTHRGSCACHAMN